MNTDWRTMLWEQFGAAIDMLERAMHACPDSLWNDRARTPEYWYLVYHTLFFLDFYLSDSAAGFAPPPPYTLSELDPKGILPDRAYSKREMQSYLDHCRTKCRARIDRLTDVSADHRCSYGWIEMTVVEALVYNMRHVQHHAAQLYLILRQTVDATPGWVARTSDDD